MKKLFLSFLVIAPLMANAQFTKGDKFLAGTVSFYSRKTPDDSNAGSIYNIKSFSINPSIGFLVKENFAIGGQLGYNTSHQEIGYYSNPATEYEAKSISAGIFAQRYFKISDKFLFTATGLFNFSRGINTRTDFDFTTGEPYEDKTHNYQLSTSIRPSLMFFPSPSWGIEASIGAISYTFLRDLSSGQKQHVFDVNYGTVTFGIAYYFRKSVE